VLLNRYDDRMRRHERCSRKQRYLGKLVKERRVGREQAEVKGEVPIDAAAEVGVGDVSSGPPSVSSNSRPL
jgi:hypothetical protein